MKRSLVLFIILLCFQVIAAQDAPTLPSQVKVCKPAVLKPTSGSTYKKIDLDTELCAENNWGTKKTVKEKEFWVVYSDRDLNPTYSDNTGEKQIGTLSWKAAVIIAEIKDNMALVYTDTKQKYPNISGDARSLGWIPMDNLLLWDKCPTDDRGVQLKALIAIHLNKRDRDDSIELSSYLDPVKNDNPKTLPMDMNFYFRMKECYFNGEGGRLHKRTLLSTTSSLDDGNGLFGWVDENSYTEWNQRACLEPNWDNDYATKYRNHEVRVYSNEDMENGAEIVTRWKYGQPNGDSEPWYRYRMAPSQLRFPILEQINEETNIIHCTSFSSNLDDSDKNANIDDDSRSVINDVEVMRKMRRQMNIIIVVEATSEMQEVFPAIKESIMKFQSYSAQGIKVQVGIVLYRGAEMGNNGIETVQLSDYDDDLLLSMLDAKKANGKLSAKEQDVSLALAIEKATNPTLMGFNKDQNNLLLVIGNRGAPDADFEIFEDNQLQDVLYDNNIQVMSIQLKRQGGNSSWGNYYDQMSDLIRRNVNRQYASMGDNAGFVPHVNGKKEADGHDFISNNNNNVLFAQMRFPLSGKELSPLDITSYVDNGINMYVEATKNWSSHFEQSLGKVDFDPDFLKRYLGENGYRRWKKVKAVSAYDGYTHKKDQYDGEYWHYILFLSYAELKTLLVKLEKPYEVAKNEEDDRKPYIEAMREMIKTQLGQQKDKSIDIIGADSLQKLIYGLNVHTEITNRYSLKEIQDPRSLEPEDYKIMLRTFSRNYEKLRTIFQDGYRYKTDIGKESFYWIPIEDLP